MPSRLHACIVLVLAFAFIVLAPCACKRASDAEAKPLHEKDGRGHPEPMVQTLACDRLPRDGRIMKTTTIPRGCVLHLDQTIVVDADATLVIEPGVHLLFAKTTGLVVLAGDLEAKGEKGAEIVFDSDATVPAEKDWAGIELTASSSSGGQSLLDNVMIEHAGSGGRASLLVHSGAHVTIGSCSVKHDGGAGIQLVP